MKTQTRLLLIFNGSVTQERLDQLRQQLRMTSIGRLGDREDAHFGYRYLDRTSGTTLSMNLWREDDDLWSFSVNASPEIALSFDDLSTWRMEVEYAISEVGLVIVERRLFEERNECARIAAWRNENWLRTAKWDLPVSTLEELWPVLGLSPSASPEYRRVELQKFMRSPTWEGAPEIVKRDADEFIQKGQTDP